MDMLDYFKNIGRATATIIEGLTVTASHMLRKPITIQYPDRTPKPVEDMLPERFRGLLDVDPNICTACTLCEQACPINCIKVGIVKKSEEEEVPKDPNAPAKKPVVKRLIGSFDIDVSLCMFCGFCTEVCPTGAIHFTRRFAAATGDINDLLFKFVKGEPVVPYKIPPAPKAGV